MSTQMVVKWVGAAVPGSPGHTPMTLQSDSGADLVPLSWTLYPKPCNRFTVSWAEPTLVGAAEAGGAKPSTLPAMAPAAAITRVCLFIVEPFVGRAASAVNM